jgi:hypothetical protein
MVLRAVLIAGDGGLADAEVVERCEPLGAAEAESAIESLLASGLLERRDERLHAAGPARHFHRLRPL